MKAFKKAFTKLCPILGSIIVFTAIFGGVKPASVIGLHQPKAPKCLK